MLDNYMYWARQTQRQGAAELRPLGASAASELKMPSRLQFIREFRKFRRALPGGQDLPGLERGQPRHAADLHEARARRAALQLDAPDLPRVHGHGAVGARRAEHDALDQGLQAQDALPGADLGDPQPHRRQPPPHERHARAAADHHAASCGSPRPAGSSTAGSTAARSRATTRGTRSGRSATCSSSRASTASGSRGSTCTAGSRRRSAARGGTRPWSGLRARRGRRCGRSRRSCAGFDDPQRHGQQRGRGAVADLDGQHRVVERRHEQPDQEQRRRDEPGRGGLGSARCAPAPPG